LVRVEVEKSAKELKETEKKVVKFQEKQKDAAGRLKKLNKSVTEVRSFILALPLLRPVSNWEVCHP
jgi:cell fate (sporulation/competence/biofilm development) regulator YmcA (YheA/YmcA/DUF963 family)